MRTPFRGFAAFALALRVAAPLGAQAPAAPDTGRRFDLGRMWTFEYAPAEYFSRTYGITADTAWFARARLSALRIPGCSASFVSPNGLIVTNHHCARGGVVNVNRPGETLLDSGFVARALEDERRIPGMYADQLLAATDVSDEVLAAADTARTDAARDAARRAAIAAVQQRLRGQYGTGGDSVWVQVVPLYSGGRWSAYVFRRYTDIRLVVAAEVLVAFFGGDPDNFTYPRYDLDFAFLRAYGPDGRPVNSSANFFRWGAEGVRSGDAVFVIGNPGATNRLTTMSLLAYHRDVEVPAQHEFLTTRIGALRAYVAAGGLGPAESAQIRNLVFGLQNSNKVVGGRLGALRDSSVMARRQLIERQLLDRVRGDEALRRRYGRLFDDIAAVQQRKRRQAAETMAFAQLLNGSNSALLRRAVWAERMRTAGPDSQPAFRQRLLQVGDAPAAVERRFLALQLGDLARALGDRDPITRAALDSWRLVHRSTSLPAEAAEAADSLMARSVFATAAQAAAAANALPVDDPALRLAVVLVPRWLAWQGVMQPLAARERELNSELGRLRFAVYGSAVPPDGSFSPRIADGVVRGYEYNGTEAPAYTTFYGMLDRFRSFGPGSDWDLPHRWRTPPAALDLGTPLNFVSTADTYGGNSGSPAVTRDLALVGLNFDRNIEGLSRDYIYLPDQQRNVMVDARAIQAALAGVYGAERIVRELLTGRP